MSRFHRATPLVCLLVAGLLAGCFAPTAALRNGSKDPPARSPAPAPAPSAPAPVTAAVGETLVGTVRLPASLIGNNGGGILTDNGTGLRVLALPEQLPVVSAKVRLLDAAGQPVVVAGRELATSSDARGRYAFTQGLPARNLVVQVEWPGGTGVARAIAPAGGQVVDVDLVSTLTTGYILGRYVQGQADPLATLERLPAAVELDTRTKAAAALARGAAPLPEALEARQVEAAVEAIRGRDPAFDAQMAYVKSLLVIGQSDLGQGRPAREVNFGVLRDMLVLPDGSQVLSAPEQGRVWRISPDGLALTLAGSGTADAGSLAGKPAISAGLVRPTRLMLDEQDRVVILDNTVNDHALTLVRSGGGPGVSRVLRVEADGRLAELWSGDKPVNIAVPLPGGALWVFTTNEAGGPAQVAPVELWEVAADGQRKQLHVFGTTESLLFHNASAYGRAPDGQIHLSTMESLPGDNSYHPAHYKLDPRGFVLTRVGAPEASGGYGLEQVNSRGDAFQIEGDPLGDAPTSLWVLKSDGTRQQLLPALDVPDAYVLGGWLTGDRAGYVLFGGGLYKVQQGAATLVAGFGEGGSQAGDLALLDPRGVAVRPDGTLVVADGARVLAIDAAGTVTAVAGNGDIDFVPGPAARTGFAEPTMLGLDRAGNLYVLDDINRGIRKIDLDDPAHPASSVFEAVQTEDPATDASIDQLAVTPEGLVFFTMKTQTDDHYTLYSLQEGGQPQAVLVLENAGGLSTGPSGADYAIATDAAGTLYVAQFGGLQRRTRAGGWETLAEDASWSSGFRSGAGMAIDARGRVYMADMAGNTLWRYDPAARRWSLLAGRGAANLAGNGVDDSLAGPGFPTFAPTGDLYLSDPGHKQVKRIPADKL